MFNERGVVPGGLTVVMPLYNKGVHVDRAIESVMRQTAGFDALIVVDDGSTDSGPERVSAHRDPRIQLLRRKPPGPGGYAARNHGIAHAKTEWIAFLDADDAWKPDFTAAIRSLIESFGRTAGCAATSFDIQDPNGDIRLQPFGANIRTGPQLLTFEDFLDAWLKYGDSPTWTSAMALRRNVLLSAGLFPEGRCRRGGDKDLWLRAMALRPVAFDPRPLATYFRDSINMVTSNVKPTEAHCIVKTIQEMMADQTKPVQRRLRSLNNMETFSYCLSAARARNMNRTIYRDFYARHRDYRYYVILLLQLAPGWLQPILGKIAQRMLIWAQNDSTATRMRGTVPR